MKIEPDSKLNLDGLALPFGGGRRVPAEIRPGTIELGGDDYVSAQEIVESRLEVSRTSAGYAFRLSFGAEIEGPCMRCLDPARVNQSVEAREVYQPGEGSTEEMLSPYVVEGELDVTRWAHDALILALPAQILCRPDCAGLCSFCGESLNDSDPADHQHRGGGDPRWDKLRELQPGDG